jgi:hypothetical protein
MKIGDDVALGIPNKSGAGSLRDLVKIQIALNSDAVMLTTAGDALLNSATVHFSSGQSSPHGDTARGPVSDHLTCAIDPGLPTQYKRQ